MPKFTVVDTEGDTPKVEVPTKTSENVGIKPVVMWALGDYFAAQCEYVAFRQPGSPFLDELCPSVNCHRSYMFQDPVTMAAQAWYVHSRPRNPVNDR